MRLLVPLLSLLFFLAFTAPAFSVDGILEINQACAVNSGCFSGDTAGFPVTIDGAAGRSYRLTGDLVVPNSNTTGINITTHDVGIDLNNFTIIGVGCVGATTSACRPTSGSGSGVRVDNVYLRYGISVRNGSITGMGYVGVELGRQAEVTNLRVRWNASAGIGCEDGCMLSGNTSFENGAFGIYVTSGATVSGNTVYRNVLTGIYSGDGCNVSGNNVFSNTAEGILTGSGSTVSENTIYNNTRYGIYVDTPGSVVSRNTVYSNGTTSSHGGILVGVGSTVTENNAYGNTGDGIKTGVQCLVQGNTVRGNTGYGLRLATSTAYRENVINDNGGSVSGGFNNGNNTCGVAACP